MSHDKDLDYLTISARIHAMENRLLNQERMDRMIEAKDVSDAAKVLVECGYDDMGQVTGESIEETLSKAQTDLFHDLSTAVGNRALLDVFRCKYDYHNAKVLVKGEALRQSQEALLVGGGRYAPARLAEDYGREDLRGCSDIFRRGVTRARETLGATGDPQMADFILDRAYFEELTQLAKASGSKFVEGFVALSIDVANLRSCVRASRLGKGMEFLQQVLVPGGNVPARTLATARGDELAGLFRTSSLAQAAATGSALSAPGSGALTDFERECDDAMMDYLGAGRRVAFGEQPIVGYLYAREAEMTAIRTILSGRMAGLDGDTIRQRLRRTYG
ncbi:V-type ATPase subunit [Pseudoflavonifractor sp. An85]|uniref:V-type ATPase subunit n=1 Tax=Pseudoflavonifractor sp. An85 TaxID=1965661 RepID=UPI000B3812BB|nr:V-type ATPase subunit [Pseudoflavonifractor sp. An85]OUN24345.1 V-type ATP synthase subunit C [Pseudoflavonifractor sp. An85]